MTPASPCSSVELCAVEAACLRLARDGVDFDREAVLNCEDLTEKFDNRISSASSGATGAAGAVSSGGLGCTGEELVQPTGALQRPIQDGALEVFQDCLSCSSARAVDPVEVEG
mmetsp:Transcript_30880/g.78072  ORF Transcript_30880/g.78072 Transcript_30880/m.78072 type:complete len:113 (-) Transcript_30880:620-958(-)